MGVKDYRELRVYQLAFESAMQIYYYNHICAQLTTMMNDPDTWCTIGERRTGSVKRRA